MAAEHHTAEKYLEDQHDKALKRFWKEWPIMKYLWGFSHTKPLSCSLKHLKGSSQRHLGNKRHPQYNKVSRLLEHHYIKSQWCWLGTNCASSGDHHSPTHIQFHFPQVTLHWGKNEVQIDWGCWVLLIIGVNVTLFPSHRNLESVLNVINIYTSTCNINNEWTA